MSLTLTLNLENEHLLHNDITEMFKSLTEEDKREITKTVLINYLTNTVDYQKQIYIDKTLAEIRKNGWKSSYPYYDKTPEQLKDRTDDEILQMDFWKNNVITKYKSPKESLFDELNNLLKSELKTEIVKFVNENNELKLLMNKHQNFIDNNWKELVTETLSNISVGFLFQAINNAQMSQMNTYNIMNIQNHLNSNNNGF
jgi:hypothetical protein